MVDLFTHINASRVQVNYVYDLNTNHTQTTKVSVVAYDSPNKKREYIDVQVYDRPDSVYCILHILLLENGDYPCCVLLICYLTTYI